jgi:hypothetical protein
MFLYVYLLIYPVQPLSLLSLDASQPQSPECATIARVQVRNRTCRQNRIFNRKKTDYIVDSATLKDREAKIRETK